MPHKPSTIQLICRKSIRKLLNIFELNIEYRKFENQLKLILLMCPEYEIENE